MRSIRWFAAIKPPKLLIRKTHHGPRHRQGQGGEQPVVAGLGVETSLTGIGRHGQIAVGLTQPGVQTACHGL